MISPIYFWNKTLHVSDSSFVHYQEFFTVHTTMVYVIQVCWQYSKYVWHIPLLCSQWKTPDDGQRNCPKHVEFYSKNKFEKLVHLVGFIIRIYDDKHSPGSLNVWTLRSLTSYPTPCVVDFVEFVCECSGLSRLRTQSIIIVFQLGVSVSKTHR